MVLSFCCKRFFIKLLKIDKHKWSSISCWPICSTIMIRQSLLKIWCWSYIKFFIFLTLKNIKKYFIESPALPPPKGTRWVAPRRNTPLFSKNSHKTDCTRKYPFGKTSRAKRVARVV
jgi:hypothetical protein